MQFDLTPNIIIAGIIIVVVIVYFYHERAKLVETNERYSRIIDKLTGKSGEDGEITTTKRTYDPIDPKI